MAVRRTVMCPSATCDDGALLLGRIDENRVVAFATKPVRLDAGTASALRQVGRPERAFRFSAPCAQSGCAQWAQGRCGVIDAVLRTPQAAVSLPPTLPACLIRPDCRWFVQRGAEACAMCRYVVTDNADGGAAETHAPGS
jgi:hypothetical protein